MNALQRLMDDDELYCRANLRIRTKEGAVVPFVWNDAQRLLQQTADGKFSLGAQDAVAIDKTDARFMHAPKVFGREQLRGFR